MHSLGNIDVILPCRVSDPERRENLIAVLGFLFKTYVDFTAIIVESDHHSVFSNYLSQFSKQNILYVFEHDTGPFNRSRCLNIGARLATSPILCFHDVDVIANIEEMKMAVRTLRDAEFSDVRYPHWSVIDVSGSLKQRFCESLDSSIFEGITPENLPEDAQLLYQNVSSAVAFYRRAQFFEIGGFNEDFVGWGGEDNEMLARGSKLGLKHHSAGAPLIHLHHGPSDIVQGMEARHAESKANGTHLKVAGLEDIPAEEFAERARILRMKQFGI